MKHAACDPSVRVIRRRFSIGLILLVAVSAGIGCQPKSETPELAQTAPAQESPEANVKTVVSLMPHGVTGDSIIIAPLKPRNLGDTNDSLVLSKGRKEALRWHNRTKETLLVVFTNPASPVGEPIGAGQLSAKFQVGPDSPNREYSYRVYRLRDNAWVMVFASGPPGEPQVGVGD